MIGGGAAGTALNVATYIGTGLGLVTLMYASIDGFSNGFAYVTLALIGFVVGVVLGQTGFVIARLRELNLMTIPEYFERRFDRRTRVTGGIICVVAGLFTKQLNAGLSDVMGREINITGYHIGFFNFAFCAAVFVVFSLACPDRPAHSPGLTEAEQSDRCELEPKGGN